MAVVAAVVPPEAPPPDAVRAVDATPGADAVMHAAALAGVTVDGRQESLFGGWAGVTGATNPSNPPPPPGKEEACTARDMAAALAAARRGGRRMSSATLLTVRQA